MSGNFAGKLARPYKQVAQLTPYLAKTAAAHPSPRRVFVIVCTYVAAPRRKQLQDCCTESPCDVGSKQLPHRCAAILTTSEQTQASVVIKDELSH